MSRVPACLLALLTLTSCPLTKQKTAAPVPASQPTGLPLVQEETGPLALPDNPPDGLDMLIADAREAKDGGAARAVAPAAPLADSDVTRLLARLSPLKAGEQKTFALRERSLPPPRTGRTVDIAFPPPIAPEPPPAAASGPLTVVRRLPEGDVPLSAHLSVTFSQPMVAVTSHEELAKLAPPLTITPPPPGHFRWIGTRTVLFEADAPAEQAENGRFAMASEFTVVVPGGTRSAVGGTLASEVRWTFRTPPPALRSYQPSGGPTGLEPLIFAEFDQRIDPAALLRVVTVTAAGKPVTVRLATPAEIEADRPTAARVAQAEKGRFLVLRAAEPLPRASAVAVTFPAGTPSAEGPRTTTAAQSFGFSTYGPMRVTDSRCGWNLICRPMFPFVIEFSNPIDLKRFQRSMVKVEPEIKNLEIAASYDSITLSGMTKSRTTYRVTVTGIPDTFVQTLEKPETRQFNVGLAEQSLSAGSAGPAVVADPAGGARFSIFSTNHRQLRVRLFSVTHADWKAYADYLRYGPCPRQPGALLVPPGKLASDETVTVAGATDDLVETPLDLSRGIAAGSSSVIVFVEPVNQPAECWQRDWVVSWVQVTSLGLDIFSDGRDLLVWANSLANGAPLAGVELELYPSGQKLTTGADGTATTPVPDAGTELVIARQGKETAFLGRSPGYPGARGWEVIAPANGTLWYVADDRGLYRPGETVNIKGWLRTISYGPKGDISRPERSVVPYALFDSQNNKITEGEARLNASGGFDFRLVLPTTMNLGQARLAFGHDHNHYLRVEEFRRPEYEVTAEASPGPHVIGRHAEVSVAARYYAGGGLPGADVSWSVAASPGTFIPPNRPGYHFGPDRGWRWWSPDKPVDARLEHQAKTDGAGVHTLGIDFRSVSPPQAMSVVAEATVMDVNRQAWAARTTLLVHPATVYAGLKSARAFVRDGDPIQVDAILADLDGNLVVGTPLRLHTVRSVWAQEGGEWKQVERDPQDCDVVSASAPARCTFKTSGGGLYEIQVVARDSRNRPSLTELKVFVAGGPMPPVRRVQREPLQLIPDKAEYAIGDTAEILVVAPWPSAEGLLTVRRDGVERSERFHVDGLGYTVKVKIEDWHAPNVYVGVDLVGSAPRTGDNGLADPSLPPRPAYAGGVVSLAVPPRHRTLSLGVRPLAMALEPGGETSVEVEVRDAQGEPQSGAEILLVVVDESVLALTGYELPDPIPVFYPHRGDGLSASQLRQILLLFDPQALARAQQQGQGAPGGKRDLGRAAGGGAPPAKPSRAPDASRMRRADAADIPVAANAEELEATSADPGAPIAVRSNFDALALFAPEVKTDGKGRATVKVKVPDSLTRYRIMAVAVAGEKQFGSGESTITARLPLMVRQSPPRFLNFGDRFELPVVLQNQTDQPMSVDVAVRASNAVITAGQGRRVVVPANDRVEVRFPAAAVMAGTARFQLAASSGRWSDASEFELPVWTPATTEAFATYGVVDEGSVRQPVAMPGGVVKEFGGLEVSTASTNLQALTDAVIYLVRYPYECAEQLSSRILGIAALRDVLTAFKADGLPSAEAMIESVKLDVDRLDRMQNWDGGWGFWKRGEESYPYLTIHVTHALARARLKGFTISPEVIAKAMGYLRNIESHIPGYYSPEARRAIIAYSIYVRRLLDEPDPAKAKRIIVEAGGVEKLGLESVGWIYTTLAKDKGSQAETAAIRKLLANRVEETAAGAHFVTAYSDSDYLLLHSDRRVDGILLEALIEDQPQSDLIPKLVEDLLGHRVAGAWHTTQENAFVLVALDKYFNTYEKVTPDFVARIWLGDRFAGEQPYKGRTTDRQLVEVPMAYLADMKGAQDLVVAKEGVGRLYYRIGMKYAPSSLWLEPADHGFVVSRQYEAVDDPKDVNRDDKGVWHVKAGARVRVRVNMVAESRRTMVALVDPMPAGLEAMNPALAVTGSLPDAEPEPGVRGGRGRGWWWGPWYQHQNLRDERAEAFTNLLWEGVYEYVYFTRATTPGNFVVPPAKAEEMYHPETFGRSSSDRLIVE